MYAFEYFAPKNLQEATKAFNSFNDSKWLAGGMTLIPSMKLRMNAPSALIDLSSIEQLKGISIKNNILSIGAMTIHADVANSLDVINSLPALASLASGIGDPQVRNRGTIGGSIANNDPAADYPSAILGLKSKIITSKKEIDAGNFFNGFFSTSLDTDELIVKINFQIPESAIYLKFANPVSRYAIVGIFLSKYHDEVRVAVTGAASCVFRVNELEEGLFHDFCSSVVDKTDYGITNLNDDIHANSEYRRYLIKVMIKKAISILQKK